MVKTGRWDEDYDYRIITADDEEAIVSEVKFKCKILNDMVPLTRNHRRNKYGKER